MVHILQLLMTPFIIGINTFNMPIHHEPNIISDYALTSNYLSIEEVKAMKDNTMVECIGVISHISNDNSFYINDSLTGIGIKVINGDLAKISLNSKIAISATIVIDGLGIKSLSFNDILNNPSMNVPITPRKISDINEITLNNMGDIIKLSDGMYVNKIKDNSYTFNFLNTDFDLTFNDPLIEEANFLNAVGDLKDDFGHPLISTSDYKVPIKSINALIIYQDKPMLELYQKSVVDIDYKNALIDAFIMDKNNNGQCVKQYDIANTYVTSLPSAILHDFQNEHNPHYMHIKARYEAWAKALNIEPYTYLDVEASQYHLYQVEGITLTVFLITVIGIGLIAMFFTIKDKLRRSK